jgi:hypothetical protein
MILFLDPAPPPRPVGDLLLHRCDGCGGAAAVRDYYAGPVRCAQCWANRHGTDPMRPIVPTGNLTARRFAGGARPAPAAAAANQPEQDGNGGRVQLGAAGAVRAPYRVLTAAALATASQIPPGAATLAAAAASTGRGVRVTYALAEERATGRLVHSSAVRLAGLGWAVWQNGAFAGARLLGRAMGSAEALAAARGEPWAPPPARPAAPKGPCPRCGASVRWRVDASGSALTWKHNRALSGEGERAVKVTCE